MCLIRIKFMLHAIEANTYAHAFYHGSGQFFCHWFKFLEFPQTTAILGLLHDKLLFGPLFFRSSLDPTKCQGKLS